MYLKKLLQVTGSLPITSTSQPGETPGNCWSRLSSSSLWLSNIELQPCLPATGTLPIPQAGFLWESWHPVYMNPGFLKRCYFCIISSSSCFAWWGRRLELPKFYLGKIEPTCRLIRFYYQVRTNQLHPRQYSWRLSRSDIPLLGWFLEIRDLHPKN